MRMNGRSMQMNRKCGQRLADFTSIYGICLSIKTASLRIAGGAVDPFEEFSSYAFVLKCAFGPLTRTLTALKGSRRIEMWTIGRLMRRVADFMWIIRGRSRCSAIWLRYLLA